VGVTHCFNVSSSVSPREAQNSCVITHCFVAGSSASFLRGAKRPRRLQVREAAHVGCAGAVHAPSVNAARTSGCLTKRLAF
jgi:hypothetical protein